MLKNLITAEEFESLAEAIQEHYRKQGDGYALQAEGASNLKGALDKERRMREEADRFLGELVPDLLDGDSATGFIPRKDWRGKVTTAADYVREAREAEFDPETWANLKASGDGKATDSELQSKLNDALAANRDLQRKFATLEREHGTVKTDLDSERSLANTLAINRDIQEALDAAKVTQPMARRFAGLTIREQKLIARRAKDGRIEVLVSTQDDEEIPVKDYVRTWSESDEGKHFVDSADNSGGGGVDRLLASDRKSADSKLKAVKTEGLQAEKKLAAVFDGKIAAR